MTITIEEHTYFGMPGYIVTHTNGQSWFASLQEAFKFMECKLTGAPYKSIFAGCIPY